ncbi:hypothetical protein OROHE_007726 [Orobanche hederae]
MTSGSNGQDDGHKTPRHPRWTRQETLVLIEAKKIVEERGWKGRKSSSVLGMENVEPKWDAVSSYCRRNGVERGAVQCRKRWSNLLSDFKKIKTWDSTAEDGGGGCFWEMRSDSRRERRLPGFFDREVYEVLDGKDFITTPEYQLALVTVSVDGDNGDGMDGADDAQYDEDEMDGGENQDGLFSDIEKDAPEDVRRNLGTTEDIKEGIPSPVPISEMKYRAFHPAYTNQEKKRHSSFQEGVKRRRRQSSSDCRNTNVDDSFIKAIERNTDLLKAQHEERNMNRRLDREEKKEQHDSLMTTLGKIAYALEKIANKL